jgi:hypothetical protein
MKRKHALIPVLVAAAMGLAAAPAAAQGRSDEGRQPRGVRAAQGAPASRQGAVRQAVPRASENRQPAVQRAVPRGNQGQQNPPAQMSPRASQTRRPPAQQVQPRGNNDRPAGARAVPRTNDRYQSLGSRPDQRRSAVQPRSGFNGYNSRRYVRPYSFEAYRPFRFLQPYYAFRPRLNIGFGLWIGFAVPYPWRYFGDYLPRVYGYYPGGYYYPSVGVRDYGGLSFDIQPSDADLYVDGEYVGTVGTFTPYGEPLTLTPGLHEIAIVRDGFRTMEWEARVEPGQVIPYRGALVPW